MSDNKLMRHLELFKSGNDFFIQINTLVGRFSLFADHPKFKFADALDLGKTHYKTSGRLSLVKLKQKDLFILEDEDANGNIDQNFIFVNESISKDLHIRETGAWYKKHIIDFLTRSLSIPFFILFLIYYMLYLRYFTTMGTLYALRYITGFLTLLFSISYYFFRSSKTKSSFLKFCFKLELVSFIVFGTISNVNHLIHINSAMDIFDNF